MQQWNAAEKEAGVPVLVMPGYSLGWESSYCRASGPRAQSYGSVQCAHANTRPQILESRSSSSRWEPRDSVMGQSWWIARLIARGVFLNERPTSAGGEWVLNHLCNPPALIQPLTQDMKVQIRRLRGDLTETMSLTLFMNVVVLYLI